MKIKEFIKTHKFILMLLFFIVSYCLFLLNFINVETDYLWHLSAGKFMFLHKTILTKDVFSWIVNGKYWMSHEWLFDLSIYILKILFGNLHIFIYAFITLFLLFLILILLNINNIKKNIFFSLFWFSLSFIIFPYIQIRPHLISYIFLSLTIYLCFDLFYNEKSKKIYFLIPIAILWSNFHGGSSNLIYLFPLIFVFCGFLNFSFSKIESVKLKKCQIMRFFIVIFISLISLCINPHGFRMILYPYSNMMDKLMISNISEWQITSLNNPTHYIYFIFIFIILIILIFSRKKMRFIDFILFLISIYLGLKSIRFWFFTYIIMNFIVFYYVDKKNDSLFLNKTLFIFSIFLFIFTIFNIKNVKTNNFVFSNKFINQIRKSESKRLFNFYDYGGELIYNNIPVFIDGRADLYSKYNYKDYLNICYCKNKYENLIKKYNFDYFIINSNFPLYNYLQYNDNYEIYYSENNIYMYKKKTS